MTREPLEKAFTACQAALSRSPGGLFTDFDGTVSHVAKTPGEARLAAGAGAALSALANHLAFVAIVTGRSADDARARIDGAGIAVIGNHGLEWLTPTGRVVHPSAVAQVEQISEAVESIKQAIEGEALAEGLIFENKELSASIHYRLAEHHDRARERIRSLANAEASERGLRVSEGRLVIELRPAVPVNKGSATRDVVRELGIRGCVFLGDDVTDVDAFIALRDLQAEGVMGVSVAVLAAETDPMVKDSADEHVDGVDECVQLITRLAAHFSDASGALSA